jgi:hypothetical protein
MMKYSSNLVLHTPISSDAALSQFVEKCLVDGVALVAIIGDGCGDLEDQVDDLIVGDGTNHDRFFCTTSHPDECLESVLEFARAFGLKDHAEEVRL